MKRRQLLKACGALPAFSAAGVFGEARKPANTEHALGASARLFHQQFHQALAKEPRLVGFRNIENNFARTTLQVEEKIPDELAGVFLRNGPAKHERGRYRLNHLFEGDGMVQRFTIAGGRVFHDGRFVNTPKFTEEEQEGEFLYAGPDTQIPNRREVYSPDVINTANTNILPVGDKLWALWEGGSAAQLDVESLEFEQFIDLGKGSDYGKTLAGLPFSAHPKVDPNGDIWNFGLSLKGQIVIYHLGKQGRLKNVALLPTNYRGSMLHDFLITERYLLFILPSITRQPGGGGLFAGTQYDDQLPMQVLVVDKNTLTLKRQFDLAPGFAFHFGNAWEERDGTIRFDASLYPNANTLAELSDVMRGHIRKQLTASQTALFTLKPDGKVEQTLFKNNSEFPRVSPNITGHKNRYLFFTEARNSGFWSDSVTCMDWQTQTQSHFNYGEGFMVEEHIPISRNPSVEAEFVIGTALHVPSQRACLNIFKGVNLEAGPIARAWLPYHLPLGFHGNFRWG